jgi:hypothetical protein
MNTKTKQHQKKQERTTRQKQEPKNQSRKPEIDPGYEHEHIEMRLTR